MATFLERDALARNDEFRTRVKMAMLTAANQILADTARVGEHDFCGRLVQEPNSPYFLDQFAYLVVVNPTITDKSSDDDIQFTVNSVFKKPADEFTGQRKERNKPQPTPGEINLEEVIVKI